MKCSIGRILPRIPGPPNQVWPQGVRSAPATERGSTQLRRFHPGGRDLPQPHARDQINIVVAGQAESVIEHADRATARLPSEPHYMLFVAARVGYAAAYVADTATLRSVLWIIGWLTQIAILTSPAWAA